MNIQLNKDNAPVILIIDDQPHNLKVLANVLKSKNYRLSFAS